MARTDPQINIRVTPELKTKVENAAKNNGRSINAELVMIIENGVKQNKGFDSSAINVQEIPLEILINELIDRYSKAGIVLTLEKKDNQ